MKGKRGVGQGRLQDLKSKALKPGCRIVVSGCCFASSCRDISFDTFLSRVGGGLQS